MADDAFPNGNTRVRSATGLACLGKPMKIRSIWPAIAIVQLAACGGGGSGQKAPEPPLVHAARPERHLFLDRIDAVGTARANEQVTLASPVTERVLRVNFGDGQFVAKGQVIAVLAQNRQVADLAGARARAVNSQQQLDRMMTLKSRGFVTNSNVDAQIASDASARYSVEAAQAAVEDRVIRAPFSGYASLRTISAGAVVNQGTPIATISDASRIKLDFTVPETQLRSVSPGVRLTAVASAYPGRTFAGTISAVDAVIDPNTRALLVRAILANPDNALKPGMLLNVSIEGGRRESLAVPELAIVGEGADRFVYVVNAAGKAERRMVTTGARDNGVVEVLTGLGGGERVIDQGVVKVAPGLRVRTSPAGKSR